MGGVDRKFFLHKLLRIKIGVGIMIITIPEEFKDSHRRFSFPFLVKEQFLFFLLGVCGLLIILLSLKILKIQF